MSVRKWYINEALTSYRSLLRVVDELTAEELTACLELESSTQRRRSVLDRLILQAVQLNRIAFNQALQEKFHGNSRT